MDQADQEPMGEPEQAEEGTPPPEAAADAALPPTEAEAGAGVPEPELELEPEPDPAAGREEAAAARGRRCRRCSRGCRGGRRGCRPRGGRHPGLAPRPWRRWLRRRRGSRRQRLVGPARRRVHPRRHLRRGPAPHRGAVRGGPPRGRDDERPLSGVPQAAHRAAGLGRRGGADRPGQPLVQAHVPLR